VVVAEVVVIGPFRTYSSWDTAVLAAVKYYYVSLDIVVDYLVQKGGMIVGVVDSGSQGNCYLDC